MLQVTLKIVTLEIGFVGRLVSLGEVGFAGGDWFHGGRDWFRGGRDWFRGMRDWFRGVRDRFREVRLVSRGEIGFVGRLVSCYLS